MFVQPIFCTPRISVLFSSCFENNSHQIVWWMALILMMLRQPFSLPVFQAFVSHDWERTIIYICRVCLLRDCHEWWSTTIPIDQWQASRLCESNVNGSVRLNGVLCMAAQYSDCLFKPTRSQSSLSAQLLVTMRHGRLNRGAESLVVSFSLLMPNSESITKPLELYPSNQIVFTKWLHWILLWFCLVLAFLCKCSPSTLNRPCLKRLAIAPQVMYLPNSWLEATSHGNRMRLTFLKKLFSNWTNIWNRVVSPWEHSWMDAKIHMNCRCIKMVAQDISWPIQSWWMAIGTTTLYCPLEASRT